MVSCLSRSRLESSLWNVHMLKTDEIKKKFRAGHPAEAIRDCEALCRSDPKNIDFKRLCALMHGLTGNHPHASRILKQILDLNGNDLDAIFNLGVSEREQLNFTEAEHYYLIYTSKSSGNWDGWVNLAECQFQLARFDDALKSVDSALRLNSAAAQAWITRADCLRALKRPDEAIESYKKANGIKPSAQLFVTQATMLMDLARDQEAIELFDGALKLDPRHFPARSYRAEALNRLGRIGEAIIDYREALRIKPDDEALLKQVSICLVNANRGQEAIDLCRKALEIQPAMLSAKLGIAWVLSKMVPTWHLPMMNETERNTAYYLGLKSAITSDPLVFEIGAGSGLLSMMAAKLGARRVVACEAVSLIAETAERIVAQNELQAVVSVLPKASFDVELGKDLPEKADFLIHEIFSSELLSEHVLPAIEDAKNRLLKPGARILPAAASIMIGLVGGEAIGKYLHVEESFGFNLEEFNKISPRKITFYRDDLNPVIFCDGVEAFRFDFAGRSDFPSESKTLRIVSNQEGWCYGVIQWIRVDVDAMNRFENHPLARKAVANWQHTIFRFDAPIYLKRESSVEILAAHDRSFPWFELAQVHH